MSDKAPLRYQCRTYNKHHNPHGKQTTAVMIPQTPNFLTGSCCPIAHRASTERLRWFNMNSSTLLTTTYTRCGTGHRAWLLHHRSLREDSTLILGTVVSDRRSPLKCCTHSIVCCTRRWPLNPGEAAVWRGVEVDTFYSLGLHYIATNTFTGEVTIYRT